MLEQPSPAWRCVPGCTMNGLLISAAAAPPRMGHGTGMPSHVPSKPKGNTMRIYNWLEMQDAPGGRLQCQPLQQPCSAFMGCRTPSGCKRSIGLTTTRG